jgi:ketosteroid isomerase-like protein
MNASDSRDVVLDFFDHLARGEGARAMALLNDDATWWVSGDPEHVPIAGTWTKGTFADLTTIINGAMPNTLSMTMTSVTADVNRGKPAGGLTFWRGL